MRRNEGAVAHVVLLVIKSETLREFLSFNVLGRHVIHLYPPCVHLPIGSAFHPPMSRGLQIEIWKRHKRF